MPTFIEEESQHPSLSSSLHLMLFKLFGVASDQLRSVMVSSWEGQRKLVTQNQKEWHGHRCQLCSLFSCTNARILTC